MNTAIVIRKLVRWSVHTLLLPALVASAALGLTGGVHGTTHVTPSAGKILAELNAHHRLPGGTTLSFGASGKLTSVTLDERGRLLVTPPAGESFGDIVSRGFRELKSTLADAGIDTAHATPANAPADAAAGAVAGAN